MTFSTETLRWIAVPSNVINLYSANAVFLFPSHMAIMTALESAKAPKILGASAAQMNVAVINRIPSAGRGPASTWG